MKRNVYRLIILLTILANTNNLQGVIWKQSSSNDFAQGQLSDVQITITNSNAYLEFLNYWTNISSAPLNWIESTVYIDTVKKFIVWGGGVCPNQTWLYDYSNNSWSNLNPSVSPSQRSAMSLIYDIVNDKVIFFGGAPNCGFGINNETWVYNFIQNKWTNMSPSIIPPSRYNYSFIYNSKENKNILFGGWGFPQRNDTWVYNYTQNKWTNMNPSNPPNGREAPAASYDMLYNKFYNI